MAIRRDDKKIKRPPAAGGAANALKKFESKLLRKKLSKNTHLKLSPNPRKLFSFNAKF